jgi:hypothetical protein
MPAETLTSALTIWPVSIRVNTPKNDDPDLLVPCIQADADAPLDGNSAQ